LFRRREIAKERSSRQHLSRAGWTVAQEQGKKAGYKLPSFFMNIEHVFSFRVQPARGWFSNTKVISQSALQKFQDEMGNIKKVSISGVVFECELDLIFMMLKVRIVLGPV
jgi:hypothetical protein